MMRSVGVDAALDAGLGARADELHAAGLAGVQRRWPGVDLREFPRAMRRLERLSLAALAELLERSSALPSGGVARSADEIRRVLGAAPRHAGLLERWLAALAHEGIIERGAAGYRWLDGPREADPPEALPEIYAALGFGPSMAPLHRRALERLAPLVRDELGIGELLFADGDVIAALGAFQDTAVTSYLNAAAAWLLGQRAGFAPGPLRVLELGGGTGLSTGPALEALARAAFEYRFTDVSRLFTQAAERRFPQPGVRCALLDINADFDAQGIEPASADVVIAGNVLHNARHVGEVLRRVRHTLAPNGWLLFIESTRENRALLSAVEFLLSPRPGEPALGCDDRRGPTHQVFIDAGGWHDELAAAGFSLELALPPADSPLAVVGQQLFWARAAAPPRAGGSVSHVSASDGTTADGREPRGARRRVIVAGTSFGRIYLAGVAAASDRFELAGVLARGSAHSARCAAHYGVPLYTSLEQIPRGIDIACVALRSGVTGGPGSDIARGLLERGVHVLQEHPVHHAEIEACLAAAKRGRAAYAVNTLYPFVRPIRQFLAVAECLRRRQPLAFIDAACSSQVAYPLLDVLGRVVGDLRPWSFSDPLRWQPAPGNGARQPFTTLGATFGGVPVTLRVQNQVHPDDPDNHSFLLHRISVGCDAGVLGLADTHGPVLWNARLHAERDAGGWLRLDGPGSERLGVPSTVALGDREPCTYHDVFGRLWPGAVEAALLELCADIDEPSRRAASGRWALGVSRAWRDLSERLGLPELIRPPTPEPLDIAALQAAAHSIPPDRAPKSTPK